MQLFRQQAVDHQHRLYGEVLLVSPLRWSIIVALLLILLATVAAFLTWGSYSRTVNVSGTSLSADRATLAVPVSARSHLVAGQPVRLLQAAAGQKKHLFHGVIEHIGAMPVDSAPPAISVTVQLIPYNRNGAPTLTPGAAIDARIVLPSRPLLQWLIRPHVPESKR